MITDRDKKVLEFLRKFHVARTSTIEKLFYPSGRVARRRLAELHAHGEIKRERDGPGAEYIWYIKRPKQFLHNLMLTDFYRELAQKHQVTDFIKEPTICGIRPDALIRYNGNVAFVEVEVSHKTLDIGKYEQLAKSGEYKKYFHVLPPVILISERKAPRSHLVSVIKASDIVRGS